MGLWQARAALAALLVCLAGSALALDKAAVEKLTQASHKLGELLYKQAGPAASAPGPGQAPPPPPQNDVVDAEYTVKGN